MNRRDVLRVARALVIRIIAISRSLSLVAFSVT